MIRKFEMPWRPAYEAYSALAWTAITPGYAAMTAASDLPLAPFWALAAISSVFAGIRWRQAWKIWSLKVSLSGASLSEMEPNELFKFCKNTKNKELWLGRGFNWLPEHTQRLYDIKKLDVASFDTPKLFKKVYSLINGHDVAPPNSVGAPWIHGVEPNEINLTADIDNFEGHTLMFGTTRAGKTRMFEILIAQAIHRGDTVFLIDPKGDKALENRARIEAERNGRTFVKVHLAFPQQSARLDPLKNFNRPTEIASRIAALVMGDGGSDAFSNFAWNVLNSVSVGMIEVGEKPSLASLRNYVETGVGDLLERVMKDFFDKNVPGWESVANQIIRNMQKDPTRTPSQAERMKGYIAFYQAELVKKNIHSDVVNGLLSINEHDAAHFGKMIGNLIPILSMLTSGETGKLLSPDYNDIDDERPIWDIKKLIDSNCVFFLGLDSLSDTTVSGAVGSLVLADIAAVAGARYNFGASTKNKISLFVDEAAEVVNPPFIQILNKGGGAGFMCWVAAQTLPDFTVKLGKIDAARKLLGNFNNLIALRTKDRVTQDFITETFGERYVQTLQVAAGISVSSEKNLTHFSGSQSKRVGEALEATIPSDILGMLPNLQYFASIAGGRIVKGRVPFLKI